MERNAGEMLELERRVDAVGWGVVFIAMGAVLLLPDLPANTWLVAVGLVLVGASVVRAVLGLRIVWLTMVCGIASLVGGVTALAGLESAAWPLALIAVGGAVLVIALGRRPHWASLPETEQGRWTR